jgi:pyrimidine operon attenuation protein/uracil phosphoribosyltransferase
METGKTILEKERFGLTLDRLANQLIENYGLFENTAIIGIQERGVILADRLSKLILKNQKSSKFRSGKLDISFYRDDFRTRNTPIKVSQTDIDFNVDGMNVILVDDVLYSGRTVQSAMSAIQDFGRPDKIELVVLVDRRFNRHLPIQAEYVGITVDALNEAYVAVEWEHLNGLDRILFYSGKKQ